MKIVCISDTHGLHRKLQVEIPDGDILIHAGDLTAFGSLLEVVDFVEWLGELPHQHKIVIAGNHDKYLEKGDPVAIRALFGNVIYLQDQQVEVSGLKIYGSPFTPLFFDWHFMLPRGPELQRKWAAIPDDTDILVTHGPARGYLDYAHYSRDHVGCSDLRDTVERLGIPLHCFGHIHAEAGIARNQKTMFCNACICNEAYQPVQAPQVIEWPIDLGWSDV